ncbi:hypothetical protein EVAR_83610_1 [Eumeta japonica]|uniref:Uncharacterized protein n=1 Tax=Eumeta variegata TaxID=151549 RepID=A0A4C1UNR6_EUMVA|nr:hypothetical protein EVAR_83610_1 [Eumeta japonica]
MATSLALNGFYFASRAPRRAADAADAEPPNRCQSTRPLPLVGRGGCIGHADVFKAQIAIESIQILLGSDADAQSDDDDVGPDDVNVTVENGYIHEFFNETIYYGHQQRNGFEAPAASSLLATAAVAATAAHSANIPQLRKLGYHPRRLDLATQHNARALRLDRIAESERIVDNMNS